MDNTNLTLPFFGQRQPIYPIVTQLIRVTGSSVGQNVYPGVVEQLTTAQGTTLRDREVCWIWEPNSLFLPQGIYKSRLVGVWTVGGSSASSGSSQSSGAGGTRPLYVTSQLCCRPISSSSTSQQSSSLPSRSSSSQPSHSSVSQFPIQNVNCCNCLIVPVTWQMNVSGIVNGTCTRCTNYNGTPITLAFNGTPLVTCQWSSIPTQLPCLVGAGKIHLWNLVCNNDGTWTLNVGMVSVGTAPVYVPASLPFNCVGTNIMALSNLPSGECSGWPATITISPA